VATCVSSTTVCREPVSQTTSCPSSSVCPRTARAIRPCGGVTLPASVWEPGRSTQRERTRGRHHTGVGRLASARGAILQRLALEVMGPHAPSAVSTCRHRSAPVTTCRHPLPGGSLEALPAERVAGHPGSAATRHGGRAPGWGERWHRTCTRSVQPQRLARRRRRREALRHPITSDCHNKWFERMGRKLLWSRQTRPYGIKKSKWSVMTGRRERSAALACPMLPPSTVSQSLAR